MSDFSTEMIETRGQFNNIFKCWKENCHSEILYLVEIPFKIESAIKAFTDIQKVEQLSLVHNVRTLKEVLQDEG